VTAQRAPAELYALIDANARLWAGEAEVFSAYFASSVRSPATDAVWLARQCFKELYDGVLGRLVTVAAGATLAEAGVRGARALADAVVQAELRHYIAFRTALDVCRDAGVNPVAAHFGDWPENTALQQLRAEHRRDFGGLGARAAAFTEGGYCTLYRAGAELTDGNRLDAAIAAACASVLDDEWDHMLAGIAGLGGLPLGAADWRVLSDLTIAQGRARIAMRNAQFGNPLSAVRVRELAAGTLAPLRFDFARAGLAAPD